MPYPHITAVVGVHDDVELIRRCIEHLESLSVDTIVVIDMKSSDGTTDVLHEMHGSGRIALIETQNDPHLDADYFGAGVAYARENFSPEWVMIQDADEFWLHPSGDIREPLRDPAVHLLMVDRFNARPCERLDRFARDASARLEDCEIFVEPLRLTPLVMEGDPSARWISGRPVGKLVVRAERVGKLTAGGHGMTGEDGARLASPPGNDLMVVHVPFLSFQRFRRKVEHAKTIIDKAPDFFHGATGWHWKRWVGILADGRLEDEYHRQFLSPETLADARAAGAVCRVGTFLAGRRAPVA